MDRNALATACQSLALFPLPRMVLMPGSILPLHVFEPRYRQLVEYCLEGHPLCIPQLQNEQNRADPPVLLPYAGIGIIGTHRRRVDGNFDILVYPLARVKLIGDLPTDTPYRVAEAELLADLPTDERELARIGNRIRGMFSTLIREEDAKRLATIPAERIPEALSGQLIEDDRQRQQFLSENDPLVRANMVEDAVLSIISSRMRVAEA